VERHEEARAVEKRVKKSEGKVERIFVLNEKERLAQTADLDAETAGVRTVALFSSFCDLRVRWGVLDCLQEVPLAHLQKEPRCRCSRRAKEEGLQRWSASPRSSPRGSWFPGVEEDRRAAACWMAFRWRMDDAEQEGGSRAKPPQPSPSRRPHAPLVAPAIPLPQVNARGRGEEEEVVAKTATRWPPGGAGPTVALAPRLSLPVADLSDRACPLAELGRRGKERSRDAQRRVAGAQRGRREGDLTALCHRPGRKALCSGCAGAELEADGDPARRDGGGMAP
jgi:hypothetical protein